MGGAHRIFGVLGRYLRALGAAWRMGEVTRGHPRARTAHERMSRGPRGAVPEELGRLVRLG